jgi:hypothetical protein
MSRGRDVIAGITQASPFGTAFSDQLFSTDTYLWSLPWQLNDCCRVNLCRWHPEHTREFSIPRWTENDSWLRLAAKQTRVWRVKHRARLHCRESPSASSTERPLIHAYFFSSFQPCVAPLVRGNLSATLSTFAFSEQCPRGNVRESTRRANMGDASIE